MSDSIKSYSIKIKSHKRNLEAIKNLRKQVGKLQIYQKKEAQKLHNNQISMQKELAEKYFKTAKDSSSKVAGVHKKEVDDTYDYKNKKMRDSLAQDKKVFSQKQNLSSRAAKANKNNIASETKFAKDMMEQQKKEYTAVQKALTERLKKEQKRREQILEMQGKGKIKSQKDSDFIESSRRKQAVEGITEKSGKKRQEDFDYRGLKAQIAEMQKLENLKEKIRNTPIMNQKAVTDSEKTAQSALKQAINTAKTSDELQDVVDQQKRLLASTKEVDKAEKRRINSLEKAKKAVERSAFMQKRDADAIEKATQESIRRAIATAKTSDELRDQVAKYKGIMASEKRLTKEKERQMYLQRRIKESSNQFVGNYVSAFAAAGAVSGVTRTGQNLESVNNTLISVSEDSQEAGEKFQFVRDQAYRLGLNLTESARGFAKLSAAQGNMSDEATRELFLGVSEVSTLIGLSAAESSRALTAIQQMSAKGKISAKFFGPSYRNVC